MSLDLILPAFKYQAELDDVSLRVPTDSEACELALRAAGKIVGKSNYLGKWAEVSSPIFERNLLRMRWYRLSTWGSRNWALDLMIMVNGEPSGLVTLTTHPMRDGAISTLVWLTRDHQGKGKAKKALSLAIETGFGHLGADTFQADIGSRNRKSNYLYRSLGFEKTEKVNDKRFGPMTRILLKKDRWDPPEGIEIVNGESLSVVTRR